MNIATAHTLAARYTNLAFNTELPLRQTQRSIAAARRRDEPSNLLFLCRAFCLQLGTRQCIRLRRRAGMAAKPAHHLLAR